MLAAGREARRQLASALSACGSSAAAGPSSLPIRPPATGAARMISKAQKTAQQAHARHFASSARRAAEGDAAEAAPQESAPTNAESTNNSKAPAQDTAAPQANQAQTPAPARRQSSATKKSSKPRPITIDTDSFPSLLREPHPILDRYTTMQTSPEPDFPYPSSVTFFNSPKSYPESPPTAESRALSSSSNVTDEVDSGTHLATTTPLTKVEVDNLQQHLLSMRRIVKMTGKGKNARLAALVVAGNGKGMVGMGEGKDENAGRAAKKAFHDAVKNMDYVERHQGHTIPAEVKMKWSSTEVTLRPRPQGFGLQVPPVIHRVARAAGITDLSASILGSTNVTNVLQATLQLLWGGSAPLGMGDGIGGKLRRRDRGRGMRTVRDIELMRGRRLREIQWPSKRSP